MKAERITDSITYHGEGPVWWEATGELRFVDMLHGAVVALAESGATHRIPVGSPVAAVLRPRAGGGAIVARERDIALARAEDLSDLAPVTPEFVPRGQRLNEGGCDPQGRFLVGGMAYDRTPGATNLWRLDDDAATPAVVLHGVTISNGIGWSPDGARAYHVDTPTSTVSLFDVTPTGELVDRRPWVVLPEEAGHPDGLTVDAEGGVWVALNGGAAVHRYDDGGRLSAVVDVGPRKVTACAFGGPGFETLFVTTSREDLEPDEEPAAGSLYAVEPGVRGLPPLPFGR
ncbi:MAG: SMP-30/gluconolactonase/LRE family protein [Actinomycetota bacterium]